MPAAAGQTPDRDCPLCPRLVQFRQALRVDHPDWVNAPVASFGGLDSRLLVVGQAPGENGANRTGRPFTGDFAGQLLYPTLARFGFAHGTYRERPDDGFALVDCRVTNAVRCAPPKHKVLPEDGRHCRAFLTAEIRAMPNLKAILVLGTFAHAQGLHALGLKASARAFAHGALHRLDGGLVLADSYHCSRYNTNTGRLTEAMFHAVVADLAAMLAPATAVCGEDRRA